MKLVSVVIITYKRPIEILYRAIQSVLNQTYREIELIVVNDAPEQTELVLQIRELLRIINDNRITYLSYEHNQGSNYARNYGIDNSKGEYIAFLDDDDEWLPDKLFEQVRVMESDEDIALVACDFLIKKNDNLVEERRMRYQCHSSIDYLLESNYIGGTSFPLLRRKQILEVGKFDVQQMSCQEYELWIRLREKSKFSSVNKILGIYYLSEDSVYKKGNKFYVGDKRILDKHEALFKKHRKAFNRHLNLMAYNFGMSRQWDFFWEYKIKALRVAPLSIANLTIIYKIFKYIGSKICGR